MQALTDRIARKVGEGYDRPNADSELPIDINYARLAEWLVDRKQVPADWTKKLQAIQAKAAAALKELPPGFLGQFEGGEDVPLDYARCKEVLAKLSETAEKGFLGSYKGAAGEWDKIVRAYEYNLLHLGEAALALGRNTDYEIPFLKRQAAKYQQQLGDLERKQAEALRSAAAAAADFQQECQALGIDGRDIRGGLLGLTAELPGLLGSAVDALKSEEVGEAADLYSVFARQCAAGAQAQVQPSADDVLPTLQEVRQDRTQPPSAPAAATTAAGSEPAGGGIDWGLDAAGDAAGGEGRAAGTAGEGAGAISWDLEASPGGEEEAGGAAEAGGGISWDLGDLGAALEAAGGAEGGGEVEGGGAPVDISWDIDVTTAGEEAAVLLEEEQQQQQQEQAGGSAAGGGAPVGGAPAFADAPAAVQRLVEDHAYRAKLLDDLLELKAFLAQRRSELSSQSNDLLASSVPEEVQHVGADAVGRMQEATAAAIAALTGERVQELLLLHSSARHLDRQAQQLAQRAGQEAKFKRAAREAEARRGEAQRHLMADSAKLAVLVKRTRAAKEEAERVLGAKLGRRINIMGEINNQL